MTSRYMEDVAQRVAYRHRVQCAAMCACVCARACPRARVHLCVLNDSHQGRGWGTHGYSGYSRGTRQVLMVTADTTIGGTDNRNERYG